MGVREGNRMYKILFADDDFKIRAAVKKYFTANGFDISFAQDGYEAVCMADAARYDLIILDVLMPVVDGLSACAQIRKKQDTPILFLSALGQEKDFLKGYTAGADDYITKPFPLSVLQEKCLAIIRRCSGANSSDIITIGEITLDYVKKEVRAKGKKVSLSAKDFEMLRYFMCKKGVVLSRSLILSRVWGYDFEGEDRVVDSHIKNIRKVLGDCANYIKTVPGMGYRFEEE